MTTFLIWALVIISIGKSSQMDCKKDILKNTSLDCKFLFTNAESCLQCENIFRISESQYFVLQLYKEENTSQTIDLEEYFHSFLKSTFDEQSTFYTCDSILRDFVAGDPDLLSENCKSSLECVQQVQDIVNGSNVKSIEIYNTENAVRIEDLHQFDLLNEVNIHDNRLVKISEISFIYSKLLKILTLKRNNFDNIPIGIFDELLHSLEGLDLSQNKIKAITNSSFGNLENLKSLNLSFNSIRNISRDTFASIPNLEEIYLMNNKFITIDEEIFRFNKYLTKIDLSCNNIKHLPSTIFHGLQNLQQINCSMCKLTELDSNLLMNLTKMTKIDFSRNDIKVVPNGFFQNQHIVILIDLSYNKIIESPEIKNKTYLKYFNLFKNEISSIDQNLSFQAQGLYYFNLGNNRIKTLTDNDVKYFLDLEHFFLNDNNITRVELGKGADLKLRKLYLSNNYISYFKVNWQKFSYLEELHVDNNQLTHLILPPCIPSIKRTITFSFQYNNISKLDATSLIKEQKQVQTDRRLASGCFFNGLSKNFVDISHNPLICDCKLYPFYNYLKQENGIKLSTFLNQRNLTCFLPKLLQNASIFDLSEDSLSCSFRTNCPEPCTCGIRGKDNQAFVNCSGSGLDEVPQEIPLKTTILYFNQNNLPHLTMLNTISWANLVELHVDYNKLINLEGWKIPQRLRSLSLKGNMIKNLPKNLMDFISNQTEFELFLGGNDKNCNCSRKTLQKFIVQKKAFIKDIDDIICEINSNGTTSQRALYTILDEVLCPKTIVVNFNPKVTIISMSVVFTVLLSLLLFYYKQRQLILSYLYIHCNEVFHVCFEENDADDDKVFDAFVAYSSMDRQIVLDILQELEEKEPHFQLCIHERNWLPGRFISDNIISSVQNSKRTIVILSNNFIASPWFRLELRAAIFKVSGDRKNKIIVILADKSTSLEGIDTELRHVISKRTYLVWGERWFWEKLRYVMPRKSCLLSEENRSINGNKSEGEIALMENMESM